MAATGHAQHVSPPVMAQLYAVHYAPSCTCTFEWRFYACRRYCGSLTHDQLDRHGFALQQRAVVRMTNLCNGINKSSAAACYTDLRVCFTCVQRLSGPLVTPFDCVFFPSFLPKFYSSLPKPRQRVITRFCTTSPTVEATQRPRATLLTTSQHSTNCQNFCRGSPQQQVSTSL